MTQIAIVTGASRGFGRAVTAALLDRGWAVAPGERFRTASPAAIRIGVATLTADETAQLAADLASVLRRRPQRTD